MSRKLSPGFRYDPTLGTDQWPDPQAIIPPIPPAFWEITPRRNRTACLIEKNKIGNHREDSAKTKALAKTIIEEIVFQDACSIGERK